jgi:hypothetical protein
MSSLVISCKRIRTMASDNVLAGEHPTSNSLHELANSQTGGHLTPIFYSFLHWLTNCSSQLVLLITSWQDHVENNAPHCYSSVIPVGTCLFANVLLSKVLYICLSHSYCLATGLHATILRRSLYVGIKHTIVSIWSCEEAIFLMKAGRTICTLYVSFSHQLLTSDSVCIWLLLECKTSHP